MSSRVNMNVSKKWTFQLCLHTEVKAKHYKDEDQAEREKTDSLIVLINALSVEFLIYHVASDV